MKYTMKGGALSLRENIVMQIKGIFTGPEKNIFSPDGRLLLRTDIRKADTPQEKLGDVRFYQYILLDPEGKEVSLAKPGYAENEAPAVFGQQICRMPRVDHAQIWMGENEYYLTMKNSQNYLMEKPSGETVMELFHRGLTGGWNIDADNDFIPEIICGIFVFCRYIEQENEFLIV